MALVHIVHGGEAGGREEDIDEALLVKTVGGTEDDDKKVEWVEYRFPDSDVIVHRSVEVTIKRMPGIGVETQQLG